MGGSVSLTRGILADLPLFQDVRPHDDGLWCELADTPLTTQLNHTQAPPAANFVDDFPDAHR